MFIPRLYVGSIRRNSPKINRGLKYTRIFGRDFVIDYYVMIREHVRLWNGAGQPNSRNFMNLSPLRL